MAALRGRCHCKAFHNLLQPLVIIWARKKINLLKIININWFKNLLHGGTSCASCFSSPHFDVFCDLLPNIHVATRSLFVKCNKRLRDNSFLQVMRKSKDCGCHYPIQRSSKLPQLEASKYVFFYHDFSPEEKKLTFEKGKLKHIYVTVLPTPKAKRIILQPKYSAGKFLTWAKRRTLTSIEQNWNTRSEVLTSPSKIEIPV